MSQHFSIDSIAMRDNRVFGWGWFLDTGQATLRSELRVPLVDGTEAVLACIPGGMRTDLRDAFPSVAHAPGAGFMLRGRLDAAPAADEAAMFVASLADGSRHEIALPDFPRAFLPPSMLANPSLESIWQRMRQVWRVGGWRAVCASARRRGRRFVANARRLVAWRMHAKLRGCVVVFDHAMGGGANRFREELVGTELAHGHVVAVVTPQLSTLQYQLDVRFSDGSGAQMLLDREQSVLEILDRAKPKAIHVNNLVSFDDPFGILAWCKSQRAADVGLCFYLHDFHAACPAFTLIERSGRYCGVPGLDVCRRCLPDNATNTLGFHQDVDILDWRGPWHRFLTACDHIVVFSEASARILLRAHPDLEQAKISLRPHRSTAPPLRQVRPRIGEQLVIAAVGHISVAKGALILTEMARIARSRRLPVRFVVIGTLDQHLGSDDYLDVLGHYNAVDLPDLLERHGVGVCLLPSICPETYSYVTDEIMQTGLPLAVFGIGAPAERVARYERGLVIQDIDAGAALDAIMDFASRSYATGWTGITMTGVAS